MHYNTKDWLHYDQEILALRRTTIVSKDILTGITLLPHAHDRSWFAIFEIPGPRVLLHFLPRSVSQVKGHVPFTTPMPKLILYSVSVMLICSRCSIVHGLRTITPRTNIWPHIRASRRIDYAFVLNFECVLQLTTAHWYLLVHGLAECSCADVLPI